MVRQRIVLGHESSRRGIEVDMTKVEVIAKLLPPKSIKDIRFFIGLGSTDGSLRILARSLGP